MTQKVSRLAATSLILLLGAGVCARPAMADTPSSSSKPSLATLSPASVKVLRAGTHSAVRAQQSGTASESFFGSTKGKVAIGLMAAGAAFTVWSINHDRKPVKSPVR